MATFTAPNTATAGDAIIASEHNGNWTYVKNWLEGVAGQEATYPGVLQNTGGTVSGNVAVTGSLSSVALTSTGTVSLGTQTAGAGALYLNNAQHDVIGLGTTTNINGETAGNWLYDHQYRAGFTATGPGNNTTELSMISDVAAPAAEVAAVTAA